MSNVVYWGGTSEALGVALADEGIAPENVRLLLHATIDHQSITRWVGIDPPPDWANRVVYQAPIEADGSSTTWREYSHGSNRSARIAAPEVDLIFARIKR